MKMGCKITIVSKQDVIESELLCRIIIAVLRDTIPWTPSNAL
jgi:hypothetical protein